MPIIHYPGYITRKEAALRQQVQVRTINDQVRRNAIEHVRIDGFVYIKDNHSVQQLPPPNISLTGLKWVPHIARANKFIPERLFEEVIVGRVTGIVVCDHVFVMPTDPELIHFLKTV